MKEGLKAMVQSLVFILWTTTGSLYFREITPAALLRIEDGGARVETRTI